MASKFFSPQAWLVCGIPSPFIARYSITILLAGKMESARPCCLWGVPIESYSRKSSYFIFL
ncbi:MAG: hypothetical protein Q4E41_06990 [Bacteroidales bacterium]|nr:hypothetical protein [Bacteroidales bacterium]